MDDHGFQLGVVSVLQLVTGSGDKQFVSMDYASVSASVFKYIGEHQKFSWSVLGIMCLFCLCSSVFRSPATRSEGSAALP